MKRQTLFYIIATFDISFIKKVKRQLEPEEIPMELVSNDISKKLKFAVLHNDEAKQLQGSSTALLEYYTLSGKIIVGPFPRSKGKQNLPIVTKTKLYFIVLNFL